MQQLGPGPHHVPQFISRSVLDGHTVWHFKTFEGQQSKKKKTYEKPHKYSDSWIATILKNLSVRQKIIYSRVLSTLCCQPLFCWSQRWNIVKTLELRNARQRHWQVFICDWHCLQCRVLSAQYKGFQDLLSNTIQGLFLQVIRGQFNAYNPQAINISQCKSSGCRQDSIHFHQTFFWI